MITRFAPAKLNLTFEIVGKRTDGYHYIKSVMQTIDLYDVLQIEKANKYQLTGAQTCPTADSTITRTYFEMREYTGKDLPCTIHLTKAIPQGAGMGGGSSDAAQMIFALNQLYDLHLVPSEMFTIAQRVGSDVSFFLVGGMCLVEGKGEQITPMAPPTKGTYYLVFRPHKRLSSKQAYEFYDRTGTPFEAQAKAAAPQLEEVFIHFPDAVISGKGPTAFVAQVGPLEGPNRRCASNEIQIMEDLKLVWNGDIFICHPVGGGIHCLMENEMVRLNYIPTDEELDLITTVNGTLQEEYRRQALRTYNATLSLIQKLKNKEV
jgi:4-diphosphocytidyl-2C-methyl-D-erythritol kinase